MLGSTRQLQFKDGVTWTLQVMAASLLDHTISFEVRRHVLATLHAPYSQPRHAHTTQVVGHNPAAAYSSALHTITCKVYALLDRAVTIIPPTCLCS